MMRKAIPAAVALLLSPAALAATYTPEQFCPACQYATSADGTTGDDWAPAINQALAQCQAATQDVPCVSVSLGPHAYRIGASIIVPAAARMTGQGLNITALVVSTSFNGSHVLTDAGSAEKIELRGFSIYGQNGAYDGINLGNHAVVYGTEGYIDQVDVHSVGGLGWNITGNVGEFGAIYACKTRGFRIMGSANTVLMMENMAAIKGNVDSAGTYSITELGDGTYGQLEVEAPPTGVNLLTLSGNATVTLVPSLDAGTYMALAYVSTRAVHWRIDMPMVYTKGAVAIEHGLYVKSAYKYLGTGAGFYQSSATITP